MVLSAQRLALTAALLVFPGGFAFADSFVDAVHGNDANGGASWSDAWRTLTHAMASTPDGEVVHIAPGVYDSALGEAFPIVPGQRVLMGSEPHPVLDGGGKAPLLLRDPQVAQGLWLRNADVGIAYSDLAAESRLNDMIVTDMADTGIAAQARFLSANQHFDTDKSLTLEHCRIARCAGVGVSLEYFSETLDDAYAFIGRLRCMECEVDGNGTAFVANHAANSATTGGAALLQVQRSRVHHNALVNAGETPWGPTGGSFGGSLVFANGEGVRELNVFNSTVVDNAGSGVTAVRSARVVRNSIVFGNLIDLDGAGLAASYTLTGEDCQSAVANNVCADPMFVDRALADYRLRLGSPAIDTGDPSTPADRTDLAGRSRWLDGDLDRVTAPDRGAYEFAPLAQRGEAARGGTVTFELWVPEWSTAALLMVPGAPLPTPLFTPFGALWLPPTSMMFMGTVSNGTAVPVLIDVPLPSARAYFNPVYSFQALILADQIVYSNPEIVIVR